jgi:hypothetical protein
MPSSTIAALSSLTGLTALEMCMGRHENIPVWSRVFSAMDQLQELRVMMHPLSVAALQAVAKAVNVQKLVIVCSTDRDMPAITAAEARTFSRAPEIELWFEKLDDCLPYRELLQLHNIKFIKSYYSCRDWECVCGWSLDRCGCWGCIRRQDPATGGVIEVEDF